MNGKMIHILVASSTPQSITSYVLTATILLRSVNRKPMKLVERHGKYRSHLDQCKDGAV